MPAIGQQMTLYLDYHIKERKRSFKEKKEEYRSKGLLLNEEETYDDLPTFEFNEKVSVKRKLCLLARRLSENCAKLFLLFKKVGDARQGESA